jgi:DNA adenine methylase
MGGKRRLAKKILPHFENHTTYVEPFCGGAALFFMKEPSKVEVLNDLNGELVNLYRVVKHHLEEFLRHFKWALISRQEYLTHRQREPETLTDIQRAERFFYLQKMAFGGKVSGQTFGTSAMSPPKMNLLRIEEDLSHAHQRLARVVVEHLDWAKCVEKYDRPTTLHYLDPPYWATTGYGNDFGLEEYERMAELAKTVKGQMVISVGDHPEMRKIFKGLKMEELEIHYTVGGGRKKATELLISNR